MNVEEFELIVIGSGPGGYVAAIKAAQLGLKTACVEKYGVPGGTCLNVGCIPSKSLLESSHLYEKSVHGLKEHGINCSAISFDFKVMMDRKKKIIEGFNQGILSLFKKNHVSFFPGVASFIDQNQIEVVFGNEKKTIKGKNFILATGSKPTQLPFAPFDEKVIVSSTGILSLNEVPKKLVVVGAGIIGVELGLVYKRLGSEVVFLEYMDRICPTLDVGVSKAFAKILEAKGLVFHLNAKVTAIDHEGSGAKITYEKDQKIESITADVVLIAIGRRPYTKGLGLEKIGVTMTEKNEVKVDANFRSSVPHILAIGDIIDGPMLAHKAEEEGIAAAEILAGHHPTVDYWLVPNVVYTDPEIGSVGLTEEEAKSRGLDYQVAQFPFKANSRARCMGEAEGFVKILFDKISKKILGMHILGPHAGELIAEGVLAMKHKMSVTELAETFHAHPTLSEAVKEAALLGSFKAIHI